MFAEYHILDEPTLVTDATPTPGTPTPGTPTPGTPTPGATGTPRASGSSGSTNDSNLATPSAAFAQAGIVDIAEATILIVDDNLQNLELMQAYLEELPCRILPANDGIEAVAMIEEESPDLILLDVMMPRMSGFEVCQKLKANPDTRDIVVIMVTALHELGDFERAVECGTNDFITKPVNKLELLTRVRSLLELSLLRRRYDEMLSLSQRVGPDEGSREEAGQKLE